MTEAERKLAAILSADVVGYSRLMAEDEAATIHTLTDYRAEIALLIEQHRGRVVDTPGDNVLAEFPTALDAVRCAVEIQGVLRARNASLLTERRMDFRIGVHMGDVAVEEGRVYGDGVNIAARLEALAEAGGICISATVREQVRNKVDVGYVDLGDQTIKNIPDQVHVYRVQPRSEPEEPERGSVSRGKLRSRLRGALVATAAVLLLLGVGLWASWPRPLGWALDVAGLGALPENPPLPDMPSVVVLPFLNLSDDPEQEYLADGITEDLTASLASNPWIFVISRSSAFTYKGAPVHLADVSRELGVRYVVEGSVRKVGERVRVTSQLIDATRDVHVWSQRYDRELGDLLDLQSEMSEQILGTVGVEIREAELSRLRYKPTQDLSAYEAFTRGLGHLRKATAEDVAEARLYFERAIAADPEYARAYAYLASSYWVESLVNCPNDLDRQTPEMLRLARRAVELDPLDPVSHLALGMTAEHSAGNVVAFERAVELAPSFDVAHFALGNALLGAGRPLEAIAAFRRALRLSPRPPAPFLGLLGLANYLAGRHERAAEFWEGARAVSPDVWGARVWLAAHYEASGQRKRAHTVAQELLRRHPDCNAQWVWDASHLLPGVPPICGTG